MFNIQQIFSDCPRDAREEQWKELLHYRFFPPDA